MWWFICPYFSCVTQSQDSNLVHGKSLILILILEDIQVQGLETHWVTTRNTVQRMEF